MSRWLRAAIALSAAGLAAVAAPTPASSGPATATHAAAPAAAPAAAHAPTISAYLSRAPAHEYYLPLGLSEISGLAVASNNSVYAHDDNFGIVYELDLATGKVLKAFALGKPTVKEDFEDIAVRAGDVYLLVSDGRLFEAPIGEHRKRVRYNVYDTGVGSHCETEGLSNGPKDGEFLILCKKPHQAKLKDHLAIFLWSLGDRAAVTSPWLNVSLDGLIEPLDQANFHPSAFYWRRELRHFVVISSKGHTAIEIDEQGHLVDRVKLSKEQHPQPEGLTIMPDGRLVMSDEGPHGKGKISVYDPPH